VREYLKSCLVMVMLLAHAVTVQAADSLDSVRREVRADDPDPPREARSLAPSRPSPAKKSPDDPWNHNRCDDEVEDDQWKADLAWVGLGAIGIAVTSPIWLPHAVLESDHQGELLFAGAPYEDSCGSMVYNVPCGDQPPPPGYHWATHIRTEYLDDFDRLTGYRGHVLLEHSNRLGFESETNYWRETTAAGSHDELWTGDANVVLRFAHNEQVQMRSGIGLAWLADEFGTDAGFNFTYGADLYPIKPVVISADLDAGWIGHAPLLHLRTTIGVTWKQAEVYTGYDYLEIGDAQLDGLIAGVRILF
jgi:hypothetical protein